MKTYLLNKKRRILQSGFHAILLLLSSCTSPHTEDGTYEGILPAADCPGIYILLAINSNKYELLEKYITHPGTSITYGDIKTSYYSRKQQLDNGIKLTPSDSGKVLLYQNRALKYISPQKKLPEIYTSQSFKENESGKDATLKIYSQNGKQYANFYFNDLEYNLEQNLQDNATEEYIKPGSDLKLQLKCQEKSSDKELVFHNGTVSYNFASLTPTNCFYTLISNGESDVPSFLDVIYYTDNLQALVKLIGISPEHCYTLPQTDASAKTAIYTDGKTEWQLGNHQNATLIINQKKYQYKEQ